MDEERAVRFTVSLPARLMRTLDKLRALSLGGGPPAVGACALVVA